MDRGDNVLFAGPVGTGKTHLAIALGVEAARQRHRVGFWRAADLVRALLEARDDRVVGRLIRRLERVDVVILDEVGFVPFDHAGGELLFDVLSARHGRRSVVITTNLAFSEWPKVFGGDEKLTTALLDRLREDGVRRVLEPIVVAGTPAANTSRADLRYVLDIGLLRSEGGALEIANPINEELVRSHWPG